MKTAAEHPRRFKRHYIAVPTLAFLSACSQCDPVDVIPIRDGEGELDNSEGEGEGEADRGEGEGEGDIGEGEGDKGEGEGEGEGDSPTCVFDENPIFDFTCEGDEDWCDDVGSDRVGPFADIVATWGRIEGDKVIIEARFRSIPLRVDRAGTVLFLNGGWGFSVPTNQTGNFAQSSPYQGTISYDSGAIGLGSGDGLIYPLASGDVGGSPASQSYSTTPTDHPYRGCSVFLSSSFPYVKYVFENNNYYDGSYLLFANRNTAGFDGIDFSIDGFDFYWQQPTGGQPDEVIDYQSICDMTCESAGGRLQ
jgi:hypothetical protein